MPIFIFSTTFFRYMDFNAYYDRTNPPKNQQVNYSISSNETAESISNVSPFLTIIHDQIVQNEGYIIHQNILDGTDITNNMRAKVRHFLMLQCEKQKYLRETCALACMYVDLYFLHRGKIDVDHFQTMAISCLILASKINEKRYPVVSSTTWKSTELTIWELNIVRCLEYRLHPCTHVTFAQRIIVIWSQFMAPQWLQSPVYQGINTVFFYEILDLIFMVVESLTFDIEQLVVNLFYLLVRKSYQNAFQLLLLLPEREIMHNMYCQDELRILFQRFLMSYSSKKVKIQVELGIFLWDFVVINHVQHESNLQRYKHTQCISEFTHLQTLPNKAHQIIKKLVSCRARYKKLPCKVIRKILQGQK